MTARLTAKEDHLTREAKVAVVEAYLQGLAGKDMSKVPFAADDPPLRGRAFRR